MYVILIQTYGTGWRWNSDHQMVRIRRGLQRDGHGIARSQPRRPLQLLFAAIQPEDRPAPRRPTHLADRVHTLKEFHPSRHQTGQFPYVSNIWY